jgi:hypothetical protein
MTSKQIAKQNRIEKLRKDLNANYEMIKEARASAYQNLMFPIRNKKMIADLEKDSARIIRNLTRLGVAA